MSEDIRPKGIQGVKFLPGEHAMLVEAIRKNDSTQAGKSLTTSDLTTKLEKELGKSFSRPITHNVVYRIRSGKPPKLRNPANTDSYKLKGDKISIEELLRVNREFVQQKLPGDVEEIETKLEGLTIAMESIRNGSFIINGKTPEEIILGLGLGKSSIFSLVERLAEIVTGPKTELGPSISIRSTHNK